jgi:di/tricarboxylate transporter
MSIPNPHAIAVLAVTITAFYLYTRPRIRMELVSLLLLLTLLVIFYLFPYARADAQLTEVEVFEAFGHPALIAICCLMILGRGLTMTGAMEPAVRLLGRVWSWNNALGLLITLIVAGFASAFVSDTPVLVLMLPLLLRLAERTGYPATRTLMPVNFAILSGGMLTAVGTSTNLLVLKTAEDLGVRRIGVFDFTGLALVAFAVALPYLWLVLPRLLPKAQTTGREANRQYEARVQVSADSARLIDRTPADLTRALGRPSPAQALVRDGEQHPLDDTIRIRAGDTILLLDTPDGLREFASAFRVDLFDRQGIGRFIDTDASRGDTHLAEVVVGSHSLLSGRTLGDVRFAEQFQVAVVGLYRGSGGLVRYSRDIGGTPLEAGDVLLIQGSTDHIEKLRTVPDLMLLFNSVAMPRSPLAPLALAIIGGVVAAAATKLLPIHVAAFIGVVAMLVTGCVRLDGVGRALSLEVVLLIASSVALGRSLVSTGAAAWLGELVAGTVGSIPAEAQLAVLMVFAALLTNFVSNAGAAAVGTPIAIATAAALHLSPEPFVLAILFGANLSFATPMAYQTNVLVMNAAGYRFADFVRGGVPLVILMLATLSVVLARRYGL